MKRGFVKQKTTINSVKSRSRAYYACVIRDNDNNKKLGLLLLESNTQNSIIRSQTHKVINVQYAWYLSECLTRYIDYSPDPKLANDKGF